MTAIDEARPWGGALYVAPTGYEECLLGEIAHLEPGLEQHVQRLAPRLFSVPGPPRPLAWAQNTWTEVLEFKDLSVGQAAKRLRAMQRNWALFPVARVRRSRLIEDALPKMASRPLAFPTPVPTAPLGSFCLTETSVLASPQGTSPFPHGEVHFLEDRSAPPNRAYLKLWEALTLLRHWPGPQDRCIDLGASPGGWTWVIQSLGSQVIAVDKAPLEPRIAALPRVEFRRESAFGLTPEPCNYLFSDVICYPERLLALAERWIAAGVENMVFTIKFQGETDHAAARRFAAIPGSRVLHLFHNKHELTWLWSRPCAKMGVAKPTP